MRRLSTAAALAAVIFAGSALPVRAAEDESSLTGDAQGVLIALIVGVVFGAYLVIQAYRDPRFGAQDHDQAHDVREGFDEHAVPEPGVEEMPSDDLP